MDTMNAQAQMTAEIERVESELARLLHIGQTPNTAERFDIITGVQLIMEEARHWRILLSFYDGKKAHYHFFGSLSKVEHEMYFRVGEASWDVGCSVVLDDYMKAKLCRGPGMFEWIPLLSMEERKAEYRAAGGAC